MNYYGATGQGHNLASELRDALFASGLPFVVSVNDVPEAGALQRSLRSGKNSSKPKLLVLRRGNPVAGAGLTETQPKAHMQQIQPNQPSALAQVQAEGLWPHRQFSQNQHVLNDNL